MAQYSPYLKIAYFLSTWLRIRIILGITVAFIVILIALSGISTTSSGNISFDRQFDNLDTSICNTSPTTYLQPFSFTYVAHNVTTSTVSNGYASCPFPITNAAFRLTICCVSIITLISLTFKSVLSHMARTILLAFSMLYFSCFVLDSNQTIIGYDSCNSKFYGTALGDSIILHKVDVTCSDQVQSAVILFDISISFCLYLVFECWGMCSDLYNAKKKATINMKKTNSQRNSAVNPMHNKIITKDDTDYTPFEGADSTDYSPYEHTDQTDYSPYHANNNTDYTPYEAQDKVDYTPYEPSASMPPSGAKSQYSKPTQVRSKPVQQKEQPTCFLF